LGVKRRSNNIVFPYQHRQRGKDERNLIALIDGQAAISSSFQQVLRLNHTSHDRRRSQRIISGEDQEHVFLSGAIIRWQLAIGNDEFIAKPRQDGVHKRGVFHIKHGEREKVVERQGAVNRQARRL